MSQSSVSYIVSMHIKANEFSIKSHNLSRRQPARMNYTSKSDMKVSRLNNQQLFEDLVRLENLLEVLQVNQRGK